MSLYIKIKIYLAQTEIKYIRSLHPFLSHFFIYQLCFKNNLCQALTRNVVPFRTISTMEGNKHKKIWGLILEREVRILYWITRIFKCCVEITECSIENDSLEWFLCFISLENYIFWPCLHNSLIPTEI